MNHNESRYGQDALRRVQTGAQIDVRGEVA
jgi:hypothetical protein